MAFTEDLTTFFDTDDFADQATITPDGGDPFTVNGIFDEGYQENSRGLVDVSSKDTKLRCASSSSVDALEHGDQVVINSQTYTVLQVKPDGTGVTVITTIYHIANRDGDRENDSIPPQ